MNNCSTWSHSVPSQASQHPLKMSEDALDAVSVLVVGAGPVGLTLAAECRRHGLSVMIIEKATGRVPYSKAFGLHARTMEVFRTMGVLPAIECRAQMSTTGLTVHFGPRADDQFVMNGFETLTGTRFKQITMCSQADTEAALEQHLRSLGGSVRRGYELTGIHEDPECSLTARIRNASDGTEQSVKCKYLAGCDGAHSTTRKLLKLPFKGEAYAERFLLGDVEVQSGIPPGPHFFFWGKRLLVTIPLKPGVVRLISTRPNVGENLDEEPTVGEFESVAAEVLPQLRLGKPEWLSLFRIHRRSVARYGKGSVFLAGDAAHIHSPIGGQGLNLGLQDVFNLAWKLSLVEQMGATPCLLDSYNIERHPVGSDVIGFTDYATKLLFGYHWLARLIRSSILVRVLQLHFVKRYLGATLSQLRHNYRRSPIVKEASWFWFDGPRAGDRVPDYPVVDCSSGKPTTTHDMISNGLRHTLILFDPQRGDSLVALRAPKWHHLLTNYKDVVAVVVVAHGDAEPGVPELTGARMVSDQSGEVHRTFAVGKGPCVYLVRPDGYVAYRARGWNARPLEEYLRTIFVKTRC